jgi:Nif-specific regulatory protein
MKSNCLVNDDARASLERNGGPKSELQIIDKPKTLISNSKTMQNIDDYIDTVSSTNTTVLILGESGVGKELIARTIHHRSRRSDQAFVKVDCAALSESHIERELFGYEKGAISGTTGCRKGSLEIANGGTLFLEEVGALSPLLQAKLFLILRNREFERIGGNRPVKVDLRIVAATTQDLEERMEKGKFNKDLYYELTVFPIVVPKLRERRQDIVLLANCFVEESAQEVGKKAPRISAAALDALMNYHWPGNVQELKGCIERAIILSADNMIHLHHLPPSVSNAARR